MTAWSARWARESTCRRVRGGGVARQGARAPPPPRHGPAVLSFGPTGFLTITVPPQFSIDDGGKSDGVALAIRGCQQGAEKTGTQERYLCRF